MSSKLLNVAFEWVECAADRGETSDGHTVGLRRRFSGGGERRVVSAGRARWKIINKLGQYLVLALLAFLSCVGEPAAAAAEPISPYSSRSWQTDDGLPDNQVRAIAQDGDGYLWVATSGGLARFDGVRFKIVELPGSPATNSPSIEALCASRDGTVWVGTAQKGLYQLKHGIISHFGSREGLKEGPIMSLYESADGSLWLGGMRRLTRFKESAFHDFSLLPSRSLAAVRSICGQSNQLWLATVGAGVSRWKDGKISHLDMPGGLRVRVVYGDAQGDLWVGSERGLTRLHGEQATLYSKANGLPANWVAALHEDRHGTLWIGTSDGLSRLSGGVIYTEKQENGVFYSTVNCFFEDREGNLWVGSKEGLHQLRPRRFLTYTRQEGLTDQNVTSVFEDRSGTIWVGTWAAA